LKIGDLFTAAYSTILATAAVADANTKDARRREWDRLIAEAKGVKIPERKETPLETAIGLKSISSTPVDLEGNGTSTAGPACWDGSRGTPHNLRKDTRWATQLSILDAHLKQSLAAASSLTIESQISPAEQIEEWLDADDPDSLLPPREPRKQIHVDRIEEMVAKLVSRLLLTSKTCSSLKNGPATQLSLQMKDMEERIQGLQAGHTQLPMYTLNDWEQVQNERSGLHRSLVTLFRKTDSTGANIEVMIAKICYNLLICSAPPNITTYNIMLQCLTRLRQHELGQIIVDSFLYDSKYMPNHATIRLILEHYTAKKDRAGFKQIVTRMKAMKGDMRIRSRRIDDLVQLSDRDWALSDQVVLQNSYLRQKAPRNAGTFEALILGCLQFSDFRAATSQVRAAIREGQQISSRALVAFVVHSKLDSENALKLLYTILSQWQNDAMSSVITYCREVRWAMLELLWICGLHAKPTPGPSVLAFEDSLRGIYALPTSCAVGWVEEFKEPLRRMLFHMELESIGDAIQRFSDCMHEVEGTLGLRPLPYARPKHSPTSEESQKKTSRSIDMAMEILDGFSRWHQRCIRRREINPFKFQRRRLQSLVARQKRRIDHIKSDLIPISYNALSPQYQTKYYEAVREAKSTVDRSITFLLKLHREMTIERNSTSAVISQLDDRAHAEEASPELAYEPHEVSKEVRKGGYEDENTGSVITRPGSINSDWKGITIPQRNISQSPYPLPILLPPPALLPIGTPS